MTITQNDIIQARRVVKNFAKPKSSEEIFYHLLFCLGVPQTTWKKTKAAIEELQRLKFYGGVTAVADIETIVKPLRFYRRKVEFFYNARVIFPQVMYLLARAGLAPGGVLPHIIDDRSSLNEFELRKELVKCVRGLGMKTASQFIRNMGGTGLAIIDTHVLKYLKKEKISGAKEYLLYEQKFAQRAKKLCISVTELDAIIWKQFSNTEWQNFIY